MLELTNIKLQVLTAQCVTSYCILGETLCSFIDKYQCLKGSYYHHLQQRKAIFSVLHKVIFNI